MLYSGGSPTFKDTDLNAPATWFDACGIYQQTAEGDDQGLEPSSTYNPSLAWTNFEAMANDFLIAGPFISEFTAKPKTPWTLSWGIVNKTETPDIACYSGFVVGSDAIGGLSVQLAMVVASVLFI